MSNYKVYYFNVNGLAEPIRYMLHYVGIDFEDIRFRDLEEWQSSYKKDMPMEQVPILEIDGVKYHQHLSICRYIAKKYNLGGSNDEESLRMDSLIDDINDLRLQVGNYYKEEDAVYKTKLKEKAFKALPFFLEKFESQVTNNNGFFFNNKITWVDIYYAGINEIISSILQFDINENYPNLKKLIENIRNHASLKKYLARRPTTRL